MPPADALRAEDERAGPVNLGPHLQAGNGHLRNFRNSVTQITNIEGEPPPTGCADLHGDIAAYHLGNAEYAGSPPVKPVPVSEGELHLV